MLGEWIDAASGSRERWRFVNTGERALLEHAKLGVMGELEVALWA